MDRTDTNLIDRFLSIGKRFGYTRTIMNRIHLMYWFLGEYYHSKIFDRRFTLLWILINVTDIVLLFSHLISYTFFSPTLELFHLLLVSDMMISGVYFMILIPLTTNSHRKRTTQAFKILDANIDIGLHRNQPIVGYSTIVEFIRGEKYSLKVAFYILTTQFCCMACYIFCTTLDLLVGYTKDKLSDPSYYLYPVYCEGIQNAYTFCVLLFSQIMAASPIIITYLIIPFFSIVMVREFHRKFQMLSDSLAYQSKLFAYHYEQLLNNPSCSVDLEQKEKSILQNYFVQDIHSYVQFHQNLIRLVPVNIN
ncbi:uncharacterized protein LOC135841041 [Planococcus citri]|uniref:uncharacterized protein LOC135841041 n=1 Tax=Planococcus citri TaxID=170843 RepID=UPI0031F8EA55